MTTQNQLSHDEYISSVQRDYKTDLAISRFSLHTDLEKHPSLYAKWSERHALAVGTMEDQKDYVSVVYAELDFETRKNWKDEKRSFTEKQVDSYIKTHPKYKETVTLLLEYREEVALLLVAKSTFESRLKSLTTLAQLFCTNYYCADANVVKEMEEMVHNKK